jgi:uncharacterized protein (TIGR02270 family)
MRLPDFGLRALSRRDERIAAHLDGIDVAGEMGVRQCEELLLESRNTEPFVAIVGAMTRSDAASLERLLDRVGTLPAARRSAAAAFGWTSAAQLRGIVSSMLKSTDGFRRLCGLKALAMHRVVSLPAIEEAISDTDAEVRCFAIEAVGLLGAQAMLPACLAALQDDVPACAYAAAYAAWLLGDRHRARAALESLALSDEPGRSAALAALLRGLTIDEGLTLLRQVAGARASARLLLACTLELGDARHVPWVLEQMKRPELVRVAGDVFRRITGASSQELGEAVGPAADDGSDGDTDLPLVDPNRAAVWWQAHRGDFPAGLRYRLGRPFDLATCAHLLREGAQRDRVAASHMSCLLRPGLPLFPTSAPAWRQRRLLGMSRQ